MSPHDRPLDPKIREFVQALARDLARRDFYRRDAERTLSFARGLKDQSRSSPQSRLNESDE